MFDTQFSRVRYTYPWNLSFDQRLARLKSKPTRVAYFYHQADNSTFRYRIYNMVEAIEKHCSSISASWFTYLDIDRMDSWLGSAEWLVICRVPYTSAVRDVIDAARRRGLRVLFDCDDLVFDTSLVGVVMDALAQDTGLNGPWERWFGYISRVNSTMLLCDGAVTSTEPLAVELCRLMSGPVTVIPNSLNEDQIRISDKISCHKIEQGYRQSGPLEIGYFSGSPSHERDFGVVAGIIGEMMDINRDLRLHLTGYIDIHASLNRHRDRIKVSGFTDFVNLQGLIGSVEINIAPLAFNRFTNCKSDLKFFEAAAVSTLTVASSTDVFDASIVNGKSGIIAREHEWRSALSKAIELVADKNAYASMVERARSSVLCALVPSVQAQRLVKLFV